MTATFPWCEPSEKSFSSDLLPTIISYSTKLHLESSQISTMELLRENSLRPKDVNYFSKKFRRRCSTGFQMHLRLERCCKCGVCVDCNYMEFIAASWYIWM